MNYDIEYILKISNRCHENNCYLASFVMYGAVLEGYLSAMCFCQTNEVGRTERYLDIKRRYKKNRKKRFFPRIIFRRFIRNSKKIGIDTF